MMRVSSRLSFPLSSLTRLSVVPTALALLTSFFIVSYVALTSSSSSHVHFLLTPSHQSRHPPHVSSHSAKAYSIQTPDWGDPAYFAAPPETPTTPGHDREVPILPPQPLPARNSSNYEEDVFHNKRLFLEDFKDMNSSFKIYVYPHRQDDPFANALLPVEFEPSGNYASESYFKKNLMKSHFITKEPQEADLFFLPFSIARLRHDPRVSVGGISDFVRSYILHISQNYPFWNRSGGQDHFYVACHSTGRSAMEKAEEVRFNAIQVVCSSSYFLSGYVSHKDASLPQVWPRKGKVTGFASLDRKKLAFFAGTVNSRVRQKLVQTWGNDSEMHVHSGRLTTPYAGHLLSSKFCLHVKGFEVNTARIADAIFYGCIPVIISDYYDLPFADVLNWKRFSLVVPALDIPLLKRILHSISSEEYRRLHKNLLKVRKHFLWHLVPKKFDAFYMVMYELWLRRSLK